MFNQLKQLFRERSPSPEEEEITRFRKDSLYTQSHLQDYRATAPGSDRIQLSTEYNTDNKFGISDIHLVVDGEIYGYVQRIEIDLIQNHAVVGHFAVDSKYTGTGLAKRLAEAFGQRLRTQHNITHILFDELKINSNPAYRRFFSNTLHATPVNDTQQQWLWFIP